MRVTSDLKNIEMILAHLYGRAKRNMPLTGGPEEDAFSEIPGLGKDPLYAKIKRGLAKGKHLSDVLSNIKGLPSFIPQVIKKGENAGDISTALSLVLKHMAVFSRFRVHNYKLLSYIVITMGTFIFFMTFFSYLFTDIYNDVPEHVSTEIPKVFHLFMLASNEKILISVLIGIFALYMILRYKFKISPLSILLRHTPLIKQNYLRIISLELAAAYSYNLELGLTAEQALAEAVDGVRDRAVSDALRRSLSAVRSGKSLSSTLTSEPVLSKLPITPALCVAEEGRSGPELIREMSEFIHKYLLLSMDKEMRSLLMWCTTVCGVIVGAGIVYVFKAILFVYWLVPS